jgi:hypothetical protein
MSMWRGVWTVGHAGRSGRGPRSPRRHELGADRLLTARAESYPKASR